MDSEEFEDNFNYNTKGAEDAAFGPHARAAWNVNLKFLMGKTIEVVVGNAEGEDPCTVAVRSPLNPSEVVLLSTDMIKPSDEANLILPQSLHEAKFFTLGWVEPYELNSQVLDELTNDNNTFSK